MSPRFDLFFPSDSVTDVLKQLVVHEPVDVVLGGESRRELVLVLKKSSLKIVGHTQVEHAGFAGEEIDVVLLHQAALSNIVTPSLSRGLFRNYRDASTSSV
jgi:hypothetical protein